MLLRIASSSYANSSPPKDVGPTQAGASLVRLGPDEGNKGSDGTLHNVTEGLDAAPVLTCTENVQTP